MIFFKLKTKLLLLNDIFTNLESFALLNDILKYLMWCF